MFFPQMQCGLCPTIISLPSFGNGTPFYSLRSPEVEGPKTHYEPVRDLCPHGLRTCRRWAHDSNQTNELPLCYFSKSDGKANFASAGAVT